MAKPKSTAMINSTESQQIPRHIARIKRLRDQIAKADGEKLKSLNAELERRLLAIEKVRSQLDTI